MSRIVAPVEVRLEICKTGSPGLFELRRNGKASRPGISCVAARETRDELGSFEEEDETSSSLPRNRKPAKLTPDATTKQTTKVT